MIKLLGLIGFLILCLSKTLYAQNSLSEQEIYSKIVNKHLYYEGVESSLTLKGTVIYSIDNSVAIETSEGAIDGGVWELSQGKLCTRLNALRQGNTVCFKIYPYGTRRYVTSHGFLLQPVSH